MSVGETITVAARLQTVVESASTQPRVAVDLESNGFHRYPERVCLVQIAVGDAAYFVDPLSVEDVSPLGRLLADTTVEKVFHSADYDVRSLDRDWGFRVGGLFDTSIAAAFTGSERLGLAAVLKEHLDVDVPKSKKLQRADWTLRPLSDEMLRYAAEDVLHLARLRKTLHGKLLKLGRTGWVEEETERLAAVRHSPQDPEWGFLSMKGSRDLDGRGLAVLRSLHGFREKEARRRDRPPFKVLSDAVLVALASEPHSDLARVKGIGPVCAASPVVRTAQGHSRRARCSSGHAAAAAALGQAAAESSRAGRSAEETAPPQAVAPGTRRPPEAGPGAALASREPGAPLPASRRDPGRDGEHRGPPLAAPELGESLRETVQRL